MATPASHLIQDQNFNIPSNGAATLGGKIGISKADKKVGHGGRKALNDISNSRNTTLLRSKKDNSTNIISNRKDASALNTKSSAGGKPNGRKALGDVTNFAKSSSQVGAKKSQKINPIAEEDVPVSVKDEGFLHNHQECIKAQGKAMEIDDFLKSVGLAEDIPMWPSSASGLEPSSKLEPECPLKLLEMEELPELLPSNNQVSSCQKTSNILGYCSPSLGSPKSPKPSFKYWIDDSLPEFVLTESPNLLNR